MNTLETPTIKITDALTGAAHDFPVGVDVMTVFERLSPSLSTPPMNVRINNNTYSLSHRLYADATIEFVDYTCESGMRTYIRTLTLIISKAVKDLAIPRREKIVFEHAISRGYYAVWGEHNNPPTDDDIKWLQQRIQEIIDADMPITRENMLSDEALSLMRDRGRHATADLIESRGKCYTDLVTVDDYSDYIFGSVLPRTGMIWGFGLHSYMDGVLMQVPDRQQSDQLATAPIMPKLFSAFKGNLDLLKALNIEDIGPMNKYVTSGKARDLITISEAMQEKQIAHIADEIARRFKDGVRIVLIAGPSSSGKTTFSKRLQTQLMTNLLKPSTLSLDDFFLNRELTPKDEKGEYDYESLYALDLPYLQHTLNAIIEGNEIEIPTFDFASGSRIFKDRKLKLGADNILIIEGIHALNPKLIESIPASSIFRVYVSALTTLSLDAHNWISTSDNRLLRRIVRDSKYRGTSASETIKRWPGVRRGEEQWIYPYQENADMIFNSAMLYELAALRVQAEPVLSQVKEIDPAYSEARRLLRFLRLFEPITFRYMPPTSLLREFLGGSSFIY